MCAFVDLYQEHDEMKWRTWIFWMEVCKDLKWKEGMKDLVVEYKDLKWMVMRKEVDYGYKVPKWTWNMEDGNIQVWMEEFQVWKEWKVYQHLEPCFLQWDTYQFQHKMRVQVYGVHKWIGQV